MPYSHLILTVHEHVATVTINRPDKLNALTSDLVGELDRAILEIRDRDDVGGAIITGAARAFVAGADITELTRLRESGARDFATRGQAAFNRIEWSTKPIVAAVNGFALGGGCELAMACHVRIAADTARFGQPEVKLGIIPGYGGTQRLPRLVGRGRALELLLTGELVDAQEALRIGLVNRVVPAGELLTAAETLVRQMLANAPLAVGSCIEAVNRGVDLPLADGLALEAGLFAVLARSKDMAEGTAAFLEKRTPHFTGR